MTSAYHLAKQNDGRGWLMLRLADSDNPDGTIEAIVVACNLEEGAARDLLAKTRAEENGCATP